MQKWHFVLSFTLCCKGAQDIFDTEQWILISHCLWLLLHNEYFPGFFFTVYYVYYSFESYFKLQLNLFNGWKWQHTDFSPQLPQLKYFVMYRLSFASCISVDYRCWNMMDCHVIPVKLFVLSYYFCNSIASVKWFQWNILPWL